MDKITAYKAMFKFLEKYYNLTKSDDIASLLGGMTLLGNGDDIETADPAAWHDWLECIKQVKSSSTNDEFKIQLK